jgi:DNA-binding CsgD family transcriptional regulator
VSDGLSSIACTLQEPHTTALLTAAARLSALADVSRDVLPELTQATHAALVFLYEASPSGVTVHGTPGASELVHEYFRDYVSACPLHAIKGRVGGAIIPTTRIAARGDYARSAVQSDFFGPHGLDHHLAVRLLPMGNEGGEIGLMLNRARKQGEFTDTDIEQVRAVVPSLTVALRFARRLDQAKRRTAELEALLLALDDAVPKVLLDADGRLVHVQNADSSLDLDPILDLLKNHHHPIVSSAKALATGGRDVAPSSLAHRISMPSGACFRAELALSDGLLHGRPLVIVRLVCTPSTVPAAWARWRLSRGELAVLAQLVAGGTNMEIGARLFISPETVRTHLTRIFKKLGVRSRLEAVVVAMRARGPIVGVR